jgi:hypothetical protein
MLVAGVVLILLGVLLDIPILYTIGVVLAVIGALLMIVGATGRAIGGRRHYW